jgi:hypothetical protein
MRKPRWSLAIALLAAVAPAACGGGGPSSPAVDGGGGGGDGPAAGVDMPPPYRLPGRIVLEPAALLFTKAGEQAQLRARVFDADGKAVERELTWESSRTGSVTVDGEGRVSSQVPLGSAQIHARAGDIVSDPVLVLIAEPAEGALLVSDAQIVGQPAIVDPAMALILGQAQRRVTLTGIPAPQPGTVVLAREGKAVAGKVVSATPKGTDVEVVLEGMPVLGLLRQIDVEASYLVDDRALALAQLGPPPPAQARAHPDGRGARSAAGAVDDRTVTPRPRDLLPETPPRHDRAFSLGPFACEAELGTNLISGEVSLTVRPSLPHTLILRGNLATGFSEVVIRVEGQLATTLAGTVRLAPGFGGVVSCKAKFTRILIPVGGLLSAVLGFQVPIGGKLGLEAALMLSPIELKPSVTGTSSVAVGFAYTPATGFVNLTTTNNTFTPKMEMTGFSADDTPFRLEGGLSAGVTTGVDLGSDVLESLGGAKPLEIVEAFLGAKLDFELGPQRSQLNDRDFASNYKVKLVAELGPAGPAQEALRWLGGPVSLKPRVSAEKELGRSPFGMFTADKRRLKPDETVKLEVKLDPGSLTLAGVDNVQEVRILRTNERNSTPEVVKTFSGSPGQGSFTYSWTPTLADLGIHWFHAVLVSTLAPGLPLEVTEDSELEVVVGDGGWTGTVSWTLMGSHSETQNNGQGQAGGTTTTVQTVSGDGELSFAPGALPGTYDVRTSKASYTYNETITYGNTYMFSGCTHNVLQTTTTNATGMSSEKPGTLLFIEDPFSGTWNLVVPHPPGSATGSTMIRATETVTGPPGGVNCSSPNPTSMDNPVTMTFPGDAFTFTGTLQPGQSTIMGTQMFTFSGRPERKYEVKYLLQR